MPSKHCAFGRCVALCGMDNYCPVHRPAALLTRVKAIVVSHIASARAVQEENGRPTTIDVLAKLRADILRDLEDTV